MRTSSENRIERGVANGRSTSSDLVIDVYRWAIVASHVAAFLFLLNTNSLTILTKDVEPLCWPYFQSCGQVRFETTAPLSVMMLIQFSLITLAVVTLTLRHDRAFWTVMFVLNVYLFAIISLDYRFRANEFYMLFWVSIVFLFWPAKRWGTIGEQQAPKAIQNRDTRRKKKRDDSTT